ncbi:cell wall-binding repeat-containing protein [Neobacillus sp. OS1-2]|uniref:cell wall-binding repeat-containing protein n=1 Tax=Neobacillus sp. OS1-2 TaxID=3070680 RepID=UPI0027DF84F7|nr:cell wall-binding repeat-containing protein [Neobacillus sp. OS1-2]WML41247.1 cell wall-binding repeat-containing protein [Neobacillus sp. OS1-2]
MKKGTKNKFNGIVVSALALGMLASPLGGISAKAAETQPTKALSNDAFAKLNSVNSSLLNRIEGADRYGTAVQISKKGWESSDYVIVVRGDDFADALAAAPLAYQHGAPILLTRTDAIDASTKQEIKRLGATHAIIVGGKSAVSKNVYKELSTNLKLWVKRIEGANRFETAAAIAAELGSKSGKAILVNGRNYPDAISVAPYAAKNGLPILLTETDGIPQATMEALKNVTDTILIGGNAAISEKVASTVKNPQRIGGETRFETSLKIATELDQVKDSVFVATGRNFADALAGSVLAAKEDAPILLTEVNELPAGVADVATDKNVTILGGTSAVSQNAIKPLVRYSLNIMHTNDTHANIDNVAKKMTAIKSVRAEKPDALLLDAGDVFSGTLYFNEYQGLADLEFMELAGYDAMTFGNHEFDMGTGVLSNFVKEASFPFVSSNVNFTNDANLKSQFHNDVITDKPEGGDIYDGIIKEVNGEKVGIFGLTTAETPTISSPGDGVAFENYIDEAKESVAALKEKGVNKIIALTHIGYDDSSVWDNDLELAKQVEGIDVIVGGHSHTKLDNPVFDETGDEPTVIVQANEYNKFLGTLDVTFDADGKVIVPKTTGKLLDITTYAEDAETAEILNTKYKPAVDEKKATVVGTAVVPLVGGTPPARTVETNLGNFITDGMLAKAQSINPDTLIAVQNGGGIRVTLPAGQVTLADVLRVLPFGNTLGIMDLKGSEVKEALEYSVKDAPSTAFGGFLQVSGLKFTYDSTKPVGEKVQTIDVKGKDGNYTALDLEKHYYVATNVFTAKGGDGFTMFGKAYTEGRVSEPGFVDWEMFNDYIATQQDKKVNPQVEGRIVNVASQTVPAASFSGTAANPKVYFGNVVVDVTGVSKLEYATVKGNLTIKGGTTVDLSTVTVEGETNFED